MGIWARFKEVYQYMLDPWLFLWVSFKLVPTTVVELVREGRLGTLLWQPAFSEVLFSNFWAVVGPQIQASLEPLAIALFQGRVSGGKILDHAVVPPLEGIVLEIGAGSGLWVNTFSKIDKLAGKEQQGASDGARRRKPAGGRLTKVYGIEPNLKSFAALQKRVKDVGMEGVYEAVPVGIEALSDPTAWSGQIEPGSVDCIVSILCLCSIPEPEKNTKLLYDLLKPGGRWYMYEHVQLAPQYPLKRLYQRFINIPWAFCVGSCRICRPTGQTIRNAGAWSKIDLTHPADQQPDQLLPHIVGTVTK